MSPCLHPELDLWLLHCLSCLVWLMVLPYWSHSHRSVSLLPYVLNHDYVAWAQKAEVDVQTSRPSRTRLQSTDLVTRWAEPWMLAYQTWSEKQDFWRFEILSHLSDKGKLLCRGVRFKTLSQNLCCYYEFTPTHPQEQLCAGMYYGTAGTAGSNCMT